MTDRRPEQLAARAEDAHPGPVEPYVDPGLRPHVHRVTDTDVKAARRAERQVAGLFGISALATIGFAVAYVALPLNGSPERLRLSNFVLGVTLGLALFCIGAAAIHWARKLMPDVEVVAERHSLAPPEESRADAIEQFWISADESGFGRRPLIRRAMIGALALLPLPAVVLLRDLGPLPENDKIEDGWGPGMRVLTDPTGRPIRAADVEVGQLINGLPESFEEIPEEDHVARQVARASDAVIVIRIPLDEINAPPGRENWDVDGILCYSKICTHVGCPINLYERTTHNLLCPCHQSTFRLNEGGKVVFGPAARPLPQLALDVDDEGYLIAREGFTEPVGPSFFERGEA